jgi:trans-2,3-dihydro-3-hydroxyanthranilate isomerase
MPDYNYQIVNVFTQEQDRFSGNPLCVFEDANGLNVEQMQAIARQFNLSETTFVVPSIVATKRARIFTPTYEITFAGHPTLGTAHVIAGLMNHRMHEEGGLSLETGAGVIPVRRSAQQIGLGTRWTLRARPASYREVQLSQAELAAALNLEANEVLFSSMQRPLWVNTGKEQLIVPLANEAAVRRARASAAAFANIQSEDHNSMALVFAPTGPETVLARFFFNQRGEMLEDPATGSASANLGGWYQAAGLARRGVSFKRVVSQGEYVKRPSTLYLEVTGDSSIEVGGEVILVASGAFTL